jgi:hypothetical protein
MFLSMPAWIFSKKTSGDRAHFSDAPSYDFALFSVRSLDFFLGRVPRLLRPVIDFLENRLESETADKPLGRTRSPMIGCGLTKAVLSKKD